LIEKDLTTLLDASSFIIDGSNKSGKITFLFYLINSLFKEKAIIFTPQESYLFNRRVKSLSKQFPLFSKLQDSITPYFLDEDWHTLKQKYGYDFFLIELEHIITKSEEKIIVLHRIGEYFEFQDRYEIENIYKSLIKLAIVHDKKLIFLANNKNENYEYVQRIAEEFTDISISITNNDDNERLINIKDILQHREYPLLHFRVHETNFILDFYKKNKEIEKNKIKNILIAEIDLAHDNMRDMCSYIFNKPNFNVKYADSLQSILTEIFISPDVVIVLMKREEENFQTISAIKRQLPDTKIVAILDQDFVRTEDMQEAYNNGCDELFANNLSLDSLILSFQKLSNTLFYTQSINSLPEHNNIMTSLEDFTELANECVERSIFFTAFTIESKNIFEKIKSSSRNSDYIYQTDHKIYYIALSTMPKDVSKIINNYKDKYDDLVLTCLWEPINHQSIDECMS